MVFFSILLGIIAIFGGVSRFCFPSLAFIVNSGWFISFVILFWGLTSICNYLAVKNAGASNVRQHRVSSFFTLLGGILAILLSIVSMFSPAIRAVFTVVLTTIFALWLLFDGISVMIFSVQCKNAGDKWKFRLFLGILLTISGIFAVCNQFFSAVAIDTIISGLLIVLGARLISIPFETRF